MDARYMLYHLQPDNSQSTALIFDVAVSQVVTEVLNVG